MQTYFDYSEDRSAPTVIREVGTDRALSYAELSRLSGISPGAWKRYLSPKPKRRWIGRTTSGIVDFLLTYDADTVRNMHFIERRADRRWKADEVCEGA